MARKPATIETADASDERQAVTVEPALVDHEDAAPLASTDPTVLALLRERDGYRARGLTARAAQVSAELARFGLS